MRYDRNGELDQEVAEKLKVILENIEPEDVVGIAEELMSMFRSSILTDASNDKA